MPTAPLFSSTRGYVAVLVTCVFMLVQGELKRNWLGLGIFGGLKMNADSTRAYFLVPHIRSALEWALSSEGVVKTELEGR